MTPLEMMQRNQIFLELLDLRIQARIPDADGKLIIPPVDDLHVVCVNPVKLCSEEGVDKPTRVNVFEDTPPQAYLGFVTTDGVFVYEEAPSIEVLLAWAAVTDIGRDTPLTTGHRSEIAGGAYAIEREVFQKYLPHIQRANLRQIFYEEFSPLVQRLFAQGRMSRFPDGHVVLLESIWALGAQKYWPLNYQRPIQQLY